MKSHAVFAIFASIIATQLIQFTLCEVVGALYFMLNQPDKNPLVVNSIHRNGTLQYVKSIHNPGSRGTGGLGELHSSNSLIVSETFIFCVNAGSNTVSSFLSQPENALDVQFKDFQDSGGDYPNALAYAPFQRMLCVSNAGEVELAGVFCFLVDHVTGIMTPATGKLARFNVLTYPLPNVPPGFGSPGDILFMENDNYVAVSMRGIPVNQALGEILAQPPVDEEGAIGHILTFKVTPGSQLVAVGLNRIGAFPSSMNVANPRSEGGNADTIGFTDPGTGEFRLLKFKNGQLLDRHHYRSWRSQIQYQQFIGHSDFIQKENNFYYYIIDSRNLKGNACVTVLSYAGNTTFTFNLGHPNLLDARIMRIMYPAGKYYLYVIHAIDPFLGKSGIIILGLGEQGANITAQTSFYPTIDSKPLPPSISGLGYYLNR